MFRKDNVWCLGFFFWLILGLVAGGFSWQKRGPEAVIKNEIVQISFLFSVAFFLGDLIQALWGCFRRKRLPKEKPQQWEYVVRVKNPGQTYGYLAQDGQTPILEGDNIALWGQWSGSVAHGHADKYRRLHGAVVQLIQVPLRHY